MTAPRSMAGRLCSWADSLLAAAGQREDACDTVADTLVATVATSSLSTRS